MLSTKLLIGEHAGTMADHSGTRDDVRQESNGQSAQNLDYSWTPGPEACQPMRFAPFLHEQSFRSALHCQDSLINQVERHIDVGR